MRKIPSEFPYESKYVDVYNSKIHYIEHGTGNPILLLHDLPASSYVWRNIIPYLATLGRCIAPDLIGLGKSDKPNIQYTVFDHIKYIDKFIETLQLKNLTIIMHGWGSVIGFDYAMRNEKNCNGLVFYESYLRPFNGDDISLPFQEQLNTLRQQEQSYEFLANGIKFVDQVLAQEMIRTLNDDEMKYYQSPFLKEGSAKPLQQFLQDIPINNKNDEVIDLISNYSKKLTQSNLPKLMLYSIPGFVTTIATVVWAKEHLPRLEIVEVGEELHYAQESNPFLMGEAISIWLQGIEQQTTA